MSLDGQTDTELIEAKPETALLPEIAAEEEADDKLVDDAYEKVKEVAIEAISGAMDTIGDYLFDKFFSNDIDRVRKKQPVKDKSFLALIKKLQDTEVDAPSKSWLYNAVNIAADKAHFKKIKFTEYEKLSATQRVYITRITNLEKKKSLVTDTLNKKYTVRELMVRIDEMIEKRERLNLGHLDTPENKEKLKTKTQKRLDSILKTIEEKLKTLNEKQRQIYIKQKAYVGSKNAVLDIIEEIKKASKKKKP